MTQVIVTALYLWLAITAIAMVVWLFNRARAQRTSDDKRRVAALDSINSENQTTVINLRDEQAAPAVTSAALQPVGAAPLTTSPPTAPPVATAATAMPSAAGPATMQASAIARVAELAGRRDTSSNAPAAPPKPLVDIDLTSALDGPSIASDPRKRSAGADTSRAAVEQTTGLADLLDGISLPLDLAPIIPESTGPSPIDPETLTAVTLVSETGSAGEIGGAFADELERLGYEIFSLSDNEAVAKRAAANHASAKTDDAIDEDSSDGDIVSLAIRTDVSAQGSSSIGGNAVAIDVWAGAGESPLPST